MAFPRSAATSVRGSVPITITADVVED